MTVLGKLEYVEIEFLSEWMGNQIGSTRTTLKSHAEELLKRKPAPIKIIDDKNKVEKIIKKESEPKVEKKVAAKRKYTKKSITK